MAAPKTNFFRYPAPTPEAESWGVVVTGAGRFHGRPGTPYPPPGHPSDHHFGWERGRVLGAFQIVYVSSGSGTFESGTGGCRSVGPGDAMLLRPGVWHRYRPNLETGWTEHWIELSGSVVDRLLRESRISAGESLVHVSRRVEFEDKINAIHHMVAAETPPCLPELAALSLGALAVLDFSGQLRQPNPVALAVDRAKRALDDTQGEALSMPELARKMGVAYSYFRREFRRQTGISPRQYLIRVRIQRAQRLLGSTDSTVKEIADQLRFSSPYHLSSAFKKHFGIAPTRWRRANLN